MFAGFVWKGFSNLGLRVTCSGADEDPRASIFSMFLGRQSEETEEETFARKALHMDTGHEKEGTAEEIALLKE